MKFFNYRIDFSIIHDQTKVSNSAKDPDPTDPQDFDFLDPDSDSHIFADPLGKYKPKTQKKLKLI